MTLRRRAGEPPVQRAHGRTGRPTDRPLTGWVDAADGNRLDDKVGALVTAATGNPPSRATIRRLVATGAVHVNGRAVRRPHETVRPGDRLQIFVELERLPRPHPGLILTDADVLFEDNWLIAINKPPGVPTHATVDPNRPDLRRATQALLGKRRPPAANEPRARQGPGSTAGVAESEAPYLGIHHRLDRDTSGVVLFTTDRSVNASVGQLFSGRNIDKTYLAVVTAHEAPPEHWTVRNHLGRTGRAGRAGRYGSVRAGGDLAVTEFRTLGEAGRGAWLIEAHPRTGRTHQVRVHLAEGGTPIVGDDLYGGQRGPRTLLHAARLAFVHPVTGRSVDIGSPLPADMTRGRRPAQEGDGK